MCAINPLAYICQAYEAQGAFTRLLDQRYSKHVPSPERPWNLILYSDEVAPGNQMSLDNRRNIWIVYFSFKELGALPLRMEDA